MTFFSVAWGILAACGDSTAPVAMPAADITPLLSEVFDAQTMGASGLVAGGVVSFAPAVMPRGQCIWNETSQGFDCPSRTFNGLTISTSFQLLDASNAPLKAYDATKVAAIHTLTDVNGTLTLASTGGGLTIQLSAHDDATLSGLLTHTHTLKANGQSSTTFTSDGMTSFMTTRSTTDLVLPERGSTNPYPTGTIVSDNTFSSGGVSSTSHVTLTFNGTSTLTVVMSAGGTTRTCTLDMADRFAQPVCE